MRTCPAFGSGSGCSRSSKASAGEPCRTSTRAFMRLVGAARPRCVSWLQCHSCVGVLGSDRTISTLAAPTAAKRCCVPFCRVVRYVFGRVRMIVEYLQRLAWDPTVPVPAEWPSGWWGVLLLFCIPGGVGIPPGVLLGHQGGLGPIVMSVLYFLSDVFLATVFEPMLVIVAVLARRVQFVRRVADAILRAVTRTMPAGNASAPFGIALTAFGAGLPFGRALGAAVGFGLVASWLF